MSYSQNQGYSRSFYVEPNANSMQNFQSANLQQAAQLNVGDLLPRSFMTGTPVVPSCAGETSWYQYAPTRAGFENYVIASGSTRIQQLARNDLGKKLGTPNLLRPPPASSLTVSEPWFNGSSYRTDILTGGYNPNC